MSQTDPITSFDFTTLPSADAYKLMIASVLPRPIALVSTINAQGQGNLAPFSFYNAVASNPPTVSLSIVRKRGAPGTAPVKKDTLRNIEETGQFVVNSFNRWILEQAHQTSGDYAYGVDEMREVGLTPMASTVVKPFRVAEAGIQMECEVYKLVEIGDGGPGSTVLVIGKILALHAQNKVLRDGQIDPELFQPVSRLGGDSYATLGERIDRIRPKI